MNFSWPYLPIFQYNRALGTVDVAIGGASGIGVVHWERRRGRDAV